MHPETGFSTSPRASNPLWPRALWPRAFDPLWPRAFDPLWPRAFDPLWLHAFDPLWLHAFDPSWPRAFVLHTSIPSSFIRLLARSSRLSGGMLKSPYTTRTRPFTPVRRQESSTRFRFRLLSYRDLFLGPHRVCVSAISSPFVGPRVSCLSSSELCRIACVSSAFGPPPSPPSLLCQHVRTWLAAYLYPFPISPAYAKALLQFKNNKLRPLRTCQQQFAGTRHHLIPPAVCRDPPVLIRSHPHQPQEPRVCAVRIR